MSIRAINTTMEKASTKALFQFHPAFLFMLDSGKQALNHLHKTYKSQVTQSKIEIL